MNFLEVAGSRTIFDSLDITEGTKQDYLTHLPKFFGFIKRAGITRDLLLDYKKHLRNQTNLSVATKNKHLAVARVTLRELYRQGHISIDLSQGVKSFERSTTHKVYGLNDEDVERLSKKLRMADDSFSTLRLRALIALLIFQGLRQVEICRLNTSDVDLMNNTLLVLGKGRDDKDLIHNHPETTKALREYLKQSQVKDGPLFTSLLGQRHGERLSTRGLRMIVKNLFNSLSIDRSVHGCRHYYTTKLIQEYKSDLTTVARYTRHRSLEMLSVYNDSIITKQDLPKYYATFRTELSG